MDGLYQCMKPDELSVKLEKYSTVPIKWYAMRSAPGTSATLSATCESEEPPAISIPASLYPITVP